MKITQYFVINLINIFQVTASLPDSSSINEINTQKCYKKELLLSIEHSPNQMTTGKDDNILYFSFDMCSGEGFYPAAIDLETKNMSMLKGIQDAFAMVTDKNTGDIYFGGAYGIYQFQPKKNFLKKLSFRGLDIWWLFVSKELFFVRYPSLNAYYYVDKTIKPLTELAKTNVRQFVFDKNGNLVFINDTGLFGLQKYSPDIFLIRDKPIFEAIATDNYGIVYVCSSKGIFRIDQNIRLLNKVFDIPRVLALTFDSDNNMIYSDSHNFVRLMPV